MDLGVKIPIDGEWMDGHDCYMLFLLPYVVEIMSAIHIFFTFSFFIYSFVVYFYLLFLLLFIRLVFIDSNDI